MVWLERFVAVLLVAASKPSNGDWTLFVLAFVNGKTKTPGKSAAGHRVRRILNQQRRLRFTFLSLFLLDPLLNRLIDCTAFFLTGHSCHFSKKGRIPPFRFTVVAMDAPEPEQTAFTAVQAHTSRLARVSAIRKS
jgi:hypothetical protein